jgi:hypothetical protein
MTLEEYKEYSKPYGVNLSNRGLRMSGLVRAGAICPVCKKGWTIVDCHLAVEERQYSFEKFPMDEYVGMTQRDARTAIEARQDAKYWTSPPDVTPDEREVPREESLKAELEEREKILNSVVKPGDTCEVEIIRFFHRDCIGKKHKQDRSVQIEEGRKGFEEMLKQAGFTDVNIVRGKIPDEFWDEFPDGAAFRNEAQNLNELPWYDVSTAEGKFGIGIFGEGIPTAYLKESGVTVQEVVKASGGQLGSDDDEVASLQSIVDDPQHPKYLLFLTMPQLLAPLRLLMYTKKLEKSQG